MMVTPGICALEACHNAPLLIPAVMPRKLLAFELAAMLVLAQLVDTWYAQRYVQLVGLP